MRDDSKNRTTAEENSEGIESDPVDRENTADSSNPDKTATENNDAASEEKWFDRLNKFQRKLESTTDPDRREELIEMIKKVEDGLVEKGLLGESERGDYSTELPPSQEETSRTSESKSDQSLSSTKEEDGESTVRTDTQDQKTESQSETQRKRTDPEDRDREFNQTQKSESNEKSDSSNDSQKGPAEVEPSREASSSRDRKTNDEGSSEDASTAADTSPGSSGETDEGSESQSPNTDDQTNKSSERLTEGAATDEKGTEPRATSEDTTDTEHPTDEVTGDPHGDSENPASTDTKEYGDPENPASTDTEETETPPVSNDTEDVKESNKAGTDITADSDIEQIQEVEALTARVEQLEDLFEEFKRSNEHEHQEIRKFSIEGFAKNMLRVRDTLERAVELFDWDEEKRTRMEAVISQFDQQFTSGDISVIEPEIGSEFDYNRHEVVRRQESADYETDKIVQIDRKGFELGDRVIRPAQVVITA